MAVGAVETLRFVAQAADADSGSEEDVLAFVGALLGGGLLGALVAAFATVFQQRAQEFRVRRIDAAEAFLSAIDETWLAVRESDVVAFITNEGLDVAGSLKATMGLDDVQAQEYQDFADEKVRLAKSRVAAEGPDAIWKKPIAEARESLANAQLADSKVALLFRPVELSDAADSVLFRLERLIDDLDKPEITPVNPTMRRDFEKSRKRFVTSTPSALVSAADADVSRARALRSCRASARAHSPGSSEPGRCGPRAALRGDGGEEKAA